MTFKPSPVRTSRDYKTPEGIFLPKGSAIYLSHAPADEVVGSWSSAAGTYTVTVPKDILIFEKAPAEPQFKTHRLHAIAFDPDLDTTGWAYLSADVCRGEFKPTHLTAGLIRSQGKAKGLAATSAMIESLVLRRDLLCRESGMTIIVEAQEIYSGSPVDANDILRLAQITGAIQALTGAIPVLPKTWKGNKQKEGMHDRARVMFPADMLAWEQPIPSRLRQHAWDAVCMAIWQVKTMAQDRDLAQLKGKTPPKA